MKNTTSYIIRPDRPQPILGYGFKSVSRERLKHESVVGNTHTSQASLIAGHEQVCYAEKSETLIRELKANMGVSSNIPINVIDLDVLAEIQFKSQSKNSHNNFYGYYIYSEITEDQELVDPRLKNESQAILATKAMNDDQKCNSFYGKYGDGYVSRIISGRFVFLFFEITGIGFEKVKALKAALGIGSDKLVKVNGGFGIQQKHLSDYNVGAIDSIIRGVDRIDAFTNLENFIGSINKAKATSNKSTPISFDVCSYYGDGLNLKDNNIIQKIHAESEKFNANKKQLVDLYYQIKTGVDKATIIMKQTPENSQTDQFYLNQKSLSVELKQKMDRLELIRDAIFSSDFSIFNNKLAGELSDAINETKVGSIAYWLSEKNKSTEFKFLNNHILIDTISTKKSIILGYKEFAIPGLSSWAASNAHIYYIHLSVESKNHPNIFNSATYNLYYRWHRLTEEKDIACRGVFLDASMIKNYHRYRLKLNGKNDELTVKLYVSLLQDKSELRQLNRGAVVHISDKIRYKLSIEDQPIRETDSVADAYKDRAFYLTDGSVLYRNMLAARKHLLRPSNKLKIPIAYKYLAKSPNKLRISAVHKRSLNVSKKLKANRAAIEKQVGRLIASNGKLDRPIESVSGRNNHSATKSTANLGFYKRKNLLALKQLSVIDENNNSLNGSSRYRP
jgi:hypothetical protein